MINMAVWTPGLGELIIILIVVLIIFGPKNLPKLARSMGRGIKEFKDATKGLSQDIEEDEEDRQAKEAMMKKEEEKKVETNITEKKETQDHDG